MKTKLKNKKNIIIIGVSLVIIIFLFLVVRVIFFDGDSNKYGDRCSDRNEYAISNDTIKDVEKKFKEIEEVDKVKVYTKLCTVKIIVTLKKDVDLDTIKNYAKASLELFSEEELGYYDFSLFVSSNDKDSEVYPINVSKHNSREDFAW